MSNWISERRTKILATLGPATDSPEKLEALFKAGVNVVRLNFSHGTHDEQLQRIKWVREVAHSMGIYVGIMADLQGPKIRVANFAAGPIMLETGDRFTLDAEQDEDSGDQNSVGIDYKDLPKDVSAGDTLLLNDGQISMKVIEVDGAKIHSEVVAGGKLSNHKGINRQGGGLSAKALTDKDRRDLRFAVEQNVCLIAISFPRHADDIHEAKALIQAVGVEEMPGVVAKIERAEAIDEIENIITASDGVMVARGDLAVEIGDAEVPLVQKAIIQHARSLDRPVIVATQMMESMITCSVPTRAEVSDVANAVLDNVDAVMLSAETAAGDYPVEAVQAMDRVCRRVEKQPGSHISGHRVELDFSFVDEAIAMAAMYTANHLSCKAIISISSSGKTPLIMSRIRTAIPIYGFSSSIKTLRKMTLYRGVTPVFFEGKKYDSVEALNNAALNCFTDRVHLPAGQRVLLTKGDNPGVQGGTNTMKILEMK
ncbi:MAG: pyruvate kinase [Coxiellaceae bacterium]|nr:pyruvate kinase [Coxiellaceae bacterium]|tara:strand:- start:1042 stop:2490 length:1449 start_codon:yes stop_codon:yes gene_type:complete